MLTRFIEEAQIGGQLQHPGIVPIYELGKFADLRPYFAMKLVQGRTLAALLAERGLAHRARPQPPNPPPQRGESDTNSSPIVGEDTGGAARAGRGPDQIPRAEPNVAPDETSDKGQRTKDKGRVATEGLPPTHDDLPRFLSIFEAICQTAAYAHARGVIHRDLKPSNVMVGSFGEVQVMDWGLAKVLPQGGNADEARSRPGDKTAVRTIRSGLDTHDSRAGSVLGTLAYMAPEQARGEIDRLDERCDVFGLGAILCEVLTGGPPFVGATREEIHNQAVRGDLADAFGRLEACGADSELVILAQDCLAAEPASRPRDAGLVAGRVAAYLAAVQERLKAAELARVEAQRGPRRPRREP